jgi:glyoxylase-like metal-dependent hydrolase (beta-lactamase superfamily II)
VTPAAISHVAITHMHADHLVGATRLANGRRVPVFSSARYYVLASEWESAPVWWQPADLIVPQKEALQAAGVVELVRGEQAIAPGVFLVPAPGETPGHAVVRVETGDRPLYYLGDLFHVPAEFSHPEWGPPYRDRALLTTTRRAFLERFAAERAWLVVTHHRFPGLGTVERESTGFRWVPADLGGAAARSTRTGNDLR